MMNAHELCLLGRTILMTHELEMFDGGITKPDRPHQRMLTMPAGMSSMRTTDNPWSVATSSRTA